MERKCEQRRQEVERKVRVCLCHAMRGARTLSAARMYLSTFIDGATMSPDDLEEHVTLLLVQKILNKPDLRRELLGGANVGLMFYAACVGRLTPELLAELEAEAAAMLAEALRKRAAAEKG